MSSVKKFKSEGEGEVEVEGGLNQKDELLSCMLLTCIFFMALLETTAFVAKLITPFEKA